MNAAAPPPFRIGQGWDSHRIEQGRPLILGGIHVPSDFGLAGHSDADVLFHATTDAILGALSLGDIGLHFPNTALAWKNASSRQFLEHAFGSRNRTRVTSPSMSIRRSFSSALN